MDIFNIFLIILDFIIVHKQLWYQTPFLPSNLWCIQHIPLPDACIFF